MFSFRFPLRTQRPQRSWKRALTESGLKVFVERKETARGEGWKDELWEGMVNSEVVIVVAPIRPVMASSQAVEVGAALAWQKPIYVVPSGDPAEEVPSYLQDMPCYPLSRLDDLIRSTRDALKPTLSEIERAALVAAYKELGVPADQLVSDPTLLDALVKKFNDRQKTRLSGEQIALELLRLRKSAGLPRLPKRRVAEVSRVSEIRNHTKESPRRPGSIVL